MWRQGDVLMAKIDGIPRGASKLPHLILAEGERTGHHHQIENPDSAELFEADGTLYLSVLGDEAVVVHEEHGPIRLGRGAYRVWMQREFSPLGARSLAD
jgi:hypothetical protein